MVERAAVRLCERWKDGPASFLRYKSTVKCINNELLLQLAQETALKQVVSQH